MKKFLALALSVLMIAVCFTACGELDRENYKKGALKYVELSEIKGITVDESSEDFKKVLTAYINDALEDNPQTFKEGTLQDGDTANIDYAGSVDGVAFSGGTAKAQSLTLGSNSFVDDFEEQLIGVKVGQTVEVKVTFPEGYSDSTDLDTGKTTIKLAGKEAVFTVTVNSFTRPYTEINDEFAKSINYDSAETIMKELKLSATREYLLNFVMENSKVKEYPSDEEGNTYYFFEKYYKNMASQYGMSFEEFLSANEMTSVQFREEFTKMDLIAYSILEKAELKIEEGAIDKEISDLAAQNQATAAEITDYYGRSFIEAQLVNEIAIDYLYNNANIKTAE